MEEFLRWELGVQKAKIPSCHQCAFNWEERLDMPVPCEQEPAQDCPRLHEPLLSPTISYAINAYSMKQITGLMPRAGGQEDQEPKVLQVFAVVEAFNAAEQQKQDEKERQKMEREQRKVKAG